KNVLPSLLLNFDGGIWNFAVPFLLLNVLRETITFATSSTRPGLFWWLCNCKNFLRDEMMPSFQIFCRNILLPNIFYTLFAKFLLYLNPFPVPEIGVELFGILVASRFSLLVDLYIQTTAKISKALSNFLRLSSFVFGGRFLAEEERGPGKFIYVP